MTDTSNGEQLSQDEEVVANDLTAARPTPSAGLRRRVRFRIGAAVERESLRRRAALLTGSGVVLLLVGIVLALSGPR